MNGHLDFYNDFDPGAAAWLSALADGAHIPPGQVDNRSILDVGADDVRGFRRCHWFSGIGGWARALELAEWPDAIPVWTGSPPCQPFSAAGKQLGRDDARHLGPRFVDLVRACRPPVLFGEQVASAAVFGPSAKPGGRGAGKEPAWAWIDDLFARLEAAGYAAWAADIPAAGVGGPHIRQRCFFGAIDLRFMADADDAGLEGRGQPGRERAAERASGQGGMAGGVADADRGKRRGFPDGEGCQRDGTATGRVESDGQPAAGGEFCPARTGAADSFWRPADWLLCRDGRWRPTEPGIFPLADGIPGRVGLLRGAGNAIVPQAAAAFIAASREILIELGIWARLSMEAARWPSA